MRRLAHLILTLFLLSWCSFVYGQSNIIGGGLWGDAKHSGGGGYTGPGDIVAGAAAWYGLRAYSSATRGTKAINLCDDTGANCTDISTNASTGILNAGGTHGTNNCDTSGTCRIATIYDQTASGSCAGSCDVTQSTNSQRPVFTPNCIGSLPCMTFTASASQFLLSAGNVTADALGGYWVTTISNSTANSLSQDIFAVSGGNQSGWFDGTTANTTLQYAGTIASVSAATGSNHIIEYTFNNGSGSSQYIDGTSTSVNPATNSSTAQLSIGSFGSGNFMNGKIFEVGLWLSDQSAHNATMCTNQKTFWGVTGTSC